MSEIGRYTRGPVHGSGMSIVEMMVVIAIISIILVIAIPMFQQYTARTQITEGMNLAAPLLIGVSEYYQNHRQWPADNSEAGAPLPAQYETDIVESIEVSATAQDGTITITYKPSGVSEITSLTNTLVYTPSVDATLTVRWNCNAGSLPFWARPGPCR